MSATKTPEEPQRTDTGLHIVMRALLSIIAGLLVADAVKACVSALTSDGPKSTMLMNAAVAVAGTIFVTRVAADNFLYYADPDVVTGFDDYLVRVSLILLDLISYASCYAIVARISVSEKTPILTSAAVRWTITYATAVELFHAIWCLIALCLLHLKTATDRPVREPWLRSWLLVSGVSCAIGLVLTIWAWVALRPGSEPVSPCVAVGTLVVSMTSAVAYLGIMRRHYIRHRPV